MDLSIDKSLMVHAVVDELEPSTASLDIHVIMKIDDIHVGGITAGPARC